MLITPNKILYTKGYASLPDDTLVIVDINYKGGELISVTTGTKQTHLVQSKFLVETRSSPMTIPNYLSKLGETVVYTGRIVHIYGESSIKDGSQMHVADGYIHNANMQDMRLVNKLVSPWEYIVVDKKYVYIQVFSGYRNTTTTRVAKPLATVCKTLTEDHNYMIELLKEPSREAVINKVMRGVTVTDYEILKGPKYFVMVPKNPETLYLPMLMAHTDIVTSVSHPTDENLEYDEALDKFTSPRGLGADDRAGCYAINRILLNHPGKFIIALFDEEEIGCIGSGQFALTTDFEKVNRLTSCFISIDRRRGYNGISQIATYHHDNKKLFELVKTATGRLPVQGSSTDCKALSVASARLKKTPGQSSLACFNMSCGYENEHQASESLYFTELQKVVTDFDALVDLAEELWEEPFEAEKAVVQAYKKPVKTTKHLPIEYWSDSSVSVDGVIYEEEDVKALLEFYSRTTGNSFLLKEVSSMCSEFEKFDYVRLNSNIVANGIYGGKKITVDMFNALSKHLWCVTAVSNALMTCTLTSEDAKSTASSIPFAWLTLVTVTDPIIETN